MWYHMRVVIYKAWCRCLSPGEQRQSCCGPPPPRVLTTRCLPCIAGEVISRLGEQLEQAGMQEVFAIPRARMPVVKFVHPDTGGCCRAGLTLGVPF